MQSLYKLTDKLYRPALTLDEMSNETGFKFDSAES